MVKNTSTQRNLASIAPLMPIPRHFQEAAGLQPGSEYTMKYIMRIAKWYWQKWLRVHESRDIKDGR